MSKRERLQLILDTRLSWLDKRIKELKRKIERRKALLLLLLFLSGCASVNWEKKVSNEQQKIENIFSKEQRLILLSFQKEGKDIFEIARLLEESNAQDLEGFIKFLRSKIHKEYAISDEDLDREIFDAIRMNYNLLKKIH